MNLNAAADNYIGFQVQDNNNRTTRITGGDLKHMHAFPTRRKLSLMEEIMSRLPTASSVVTGHNHYEKTILKIHKDEFQLIDLQPQEHLLTSVWCRNTRSMFGLNRFEVVMVLWAVEDDLTSMTMWRL